jgi:hypothetical protein
MMSRLMDEVECEEAEDRALLVKKCGMIYASNLKVSREKAEAENAKR